jgi:hypothetical protein
MIHRTGILLALKRRLGRSEAMLRAKKNLVSELLIGRARLRPSRAQNGTGVPPVSDETEKTGGTPRPTLSAARSIAAPSAIPALPLRLERHLN